MPTRLVVLVLMMLLVVGGGLLLRDRDDPLLEPADAVFRGGPEEAPPEARLAGARDATTVADGASYADADAARVLGAFVNQPPNVPAGAVARLREIVGEDPSLLEHLVRVALGDEPLRAELVPADYPYEVRQAAAWAIEALGRPTARILASRLAVETDPGMRRAIYRVLSRLGQDAAPAVGALVVRMRDTGLQARERGEAVHVLGAIGAEAEVARPDLLAILRDPDDDLFGYALNSVVPVAGMTDAVRDAFVELLAIEDHDIRIEVLDVVLRHVGDDVRALRPALLGLVETGNADVRCMALACLQPVGVADAASASLVRRRLEEGDVDEEQAARGVLLASGEEGLALLADTVRTTDDVDLTVRTARALAQAGAGGRVSGAALLHVFRTCDPNAVHHVVGLLDVLPDGVEAGAALPVVRAELGDPEGDRRWAAVEVLSAVRGDDEAVLALLRETLEDPSLRDFAFDALGRMGRIADRVVPLLEAQARRGRLQAVNALGTLAVASRIARATLHRLAAGDDEALRDFATRRLAEVPAAPNAR